MIGQENLLSAIRKQIKDDTFPHFTILVGDKGSGKKTLAQEIEKMLNITVYNIPDVKMENIRWLIEEAYKTKVPALYIIQDADEMSVNAKNALLKVTEEPPNNAYFLMTLENENNTLPTIRSRGTIYHMDTYSKDEIEAYEVEKYFDDNSTEVSIVHDLCDNLGEVDLLHKMEVQNFYNYVQLTVDNIATVSGANCFKIADKIAFKDDEINGDKYDLKMFWKAFCSVCRFEARKSDNVDDAQYYINGCLLTSNYIKDLRIKSVNKQMLFDHWILAIRRLWM